jgi:hypothetical protein
MNDIEERFALALQSAAYGLILRAPCPTDRRVRKYC